MSFRLKDEAALQAFLTSHGLPGAKQPGAAQESCDFRPLTFETHQPSAFRMTGFITILASVGSVGLLILAMSSLLWAIAFVLALLEATR